MRLIIVFGALLFGAPAQAEHFYPRDECGELEGADSFRNELATAVANRDEAMLQPLVSPDIKLNFGGDYGWDTMREWLRDPNIRLWEELDKVLALGCRSRGGEYEGEYADEGDVEYLWMPWMWMQDLGFEDPFSTYVAMGKDVAMRAGPEPDAPIVRRLNWEAVKLFKYPADDGNIVLIRTSQGEEGYTDFRFLRSQLDYRLSAERRDGKWIIHAFLAGD